MIALAAAPPPGALARTATRSHRVRLSGAIETLHSTGTVGSPGVIDTDTGILDGSVAGTPAWHGAVRQRVTWQADLAVVAQGTAFAPAGSVRFTWKGRFVPTAAGRLTLTGTMTVNGGTGAYAGARGTLRITGLATVSTGATRSSFDLAGSVRLPVRG